MAKQTKNNNADIGKSLYLAGMSQREVAIKVGVSEATVARWCRAGDWATIRKAMSTSKPDILRKMYAELSELNTLIQGREEGYRFADKDEALMRSRLINDINKLETRYDLGNAIMIGKDFINYLTGIDIGLAKQMVQLYDGFVSGLVDRAKGIDEAEE